MSGGEASPRPSAGPGGWDPGGGAGAGVGGLRAAPGWTARSCFRTDKRLTASGSCPPGTRAWFLPAAFTAPGQAGGPPGCPPSVPPPCVHCIGYKEGQVPLGALQEGGPGGGTSRRGHIREPPSPLHPPAPRISQSSSIWALGRGSAIQAATGVGPPDQRARPGLAEAPGTGWTGLGSRWGGWCPLPAPLGQCSSHTDQPQPPAALQAVGVPAPPQVRARGGRQVGSGSTSSQAGCWCLSVPPDPPAPQGQRGLGGQEWPTPGVGERDPGVSSLCFLSVRCPWAPEPAPSAIQPR